ncbi:GNAT family N-acetyltransferase [Bifidobacterium avesanii]|uniref:GNAT family N-acetyltransferase n=1 Tax=Bifidobacterium avesanii TaxID=1798157 RepID=A0A7K3TH33_9BIFI|nr:GNAT family N-acetyltransferase [Bifidobacterium avesanii]KAB8292799.1 acetyltransferase [Bifidobacterium avesanii]NEG78405.1 GNAT family N-acetyltransferase [Bifidobacterium avesanii]
MAKTIETGRLLLRPWKPDDAADAASLFRYASDPEIGPLCGWPPHTSVEESRNVIGTVFAVENNWAVTVKGGAASDGDDGPIGCIELKPLRHVTGSIRSDCERYLGGNALELGYWLGRPFWGLGYMSEALRAVIDYAFDALHVDAVWGAHYTENARSGRVMEKCGMRMAGGSKHDYFSLIDEYHDEFFRIVTAEEWRAA